VIEKEGALRLTMATGGYRFVDRLDTKKMF